MKITPAQGLPATISYRSRGSLDEWPFARLVVDVTGKPGEETIEIGSWIPGVDEISVHSYTDDAPLRESGATLVATRGTETFSFTCPAIGSGRWWRVLRLDAGEQRTSLLNLLAESGFA